MANPSPVPMPYRQPSEALIPLSDSFRYPQSQHQQLAITNPVGRSELPPAMVGGPNALGLLKSLRRRWLVALSLGLVLGAAAGGAVWTMLPPKFTAKAVLHLASRAPSVIGSGSESTTEFLMYQKTQSALVKGRLVIVAALRKPKVANLGIVKDQSDPVDWLERDLIVDFNLSPELMRVSLSGKNPDDVIALLNAVIDAYLEEIVTQEQRGRSDKLTTLKAISTRYDALLEAKKKEISTLRETAGASDASVLAMKQQFQQERLTTVQKELLSLQKDIRKTQAEIVTMQNRKDGVEPPPVNPAEVEALLEKDKLIDDYRSRIAKLEEDIDKSASATELGKSHPRLRELIDEVDGLKKAMALRRETQRPLAIEQLRHRGQSTSKDGLALAQANLAMFQELERSYQSDVNRLSEEIQKSGKQGGSLDDHRREFNQYEEKALKYRQDVENWSLELNSAPRVTIRDEAVIRLARDGKKQMMMAAGAGGSIFALIVLGIALMEYRERKIDGLDDVTQGLGWRLIGTLPTLGASGKPAKGKAQMLTESIDATRTMLLHFARTEGVKSVMVTSAVAGEGKTSLSCHLASSLARAGRKTLLIDGDMRRPAVHRMFQLHGAPGLSELLRGEATFQDVIQPTSAEGLWVIPAGKLDGATLQGLSSELLPALLGKLKTHYDFLVIDSSPVLPVVDALVIGQCADLVLFSLLKDVSRIPTVFMASEKLRALNIRMVGAVMSGIDKEQYDYESHGSLTTA